jgi:hypothetical protein
MLVSWAKPWIGTGPNWKRPPFADNSLRVQQNLVQNLGASILWDDRPSTWPERVARPATAGVPPKGVTVFATLNHHNRRSALHSNITLPSKVAMPLESALSTFKVWLRCRSHCTIYTISPQMYMQYPHATGDSVCISHCVIGTKSRTPSEGLPSTGRVAGWRPWRPALPLRRSEPSRASPVLAKTFSLPLLRCSDHTSFINVDSL